MAIMLKADMNKKVQVFLFMSVFKFRWRRQLGGIIFTFFQFPLKLNDNHSLCLKRPYSSFTLKCALFERAASPSFT